VYIYELRLKNFRCFQNISVQFKEGLNVIIGENNAGKTTILKALDLIFNNAKSRRLSIDDFYRGLSLEDDFPPYVEIEITIRSSGDSDSKDDLAVVATWVTRLEDPWEATLTYKYFLPERDVKDFQEEFSDLTSRPTNTSEAWALLEKYIPKYVYKIYAGNPELKNQVETEYLNLFNCEFLDALRDVKNELFAGRRTILKDALTYYLDYAHKQSECEQQLEVQKSDFQKSSKLLLENIKSRIKPDDLSNFLGFTGANIGGTLDITGEISEEDIIAALNLVTKKYGSEIAISNNGLGYCNLLYISLVLSKMESLRSENYGQNATVFPILLLEEPEAHLHPALQHYFLRSLLDEGRDQKNVRQIFVTSHSTHITSAVDLDSIICMTLDGNNIRVAYPGKVFSEKDTDSKHYIERYLDATKSSLLFAKSVIFVEGITEKLVIPVLADISLERPLERSLVCVVDVGGKTFKHFIKLFGAGVSEDRKQYALTRRVACITDTDPSKKEKNKQNSRYTSCYPFEIDLESGKYEYKSIADHIEKLESQVKDSPNVKIFYRKDKRGKTFEYDLAYDNPDSDLLQTQPTSSCDKEIVDSIEQCKWKPEEIKRAKYALSYAKGISKGENAFILAQNLKLSLATEPQFVVPEHILEAVLWVCSDSRDG
jgi:putative ATP-dependent endonuclease of OLD family